MSDAWATDELKALYANLTATQERCNTLLEEAREARRERDAYRLAAEINAESLLDALAVCDRLAARVRQLEGGDGLRDEKASKAWD